MGCERRLVAPLALALAAAVALGACAGSGYDPPVSRVVTGGDAAVGERLITRYGCGSCHTIPGVKGADGLVGPPLTKFGRRTFIAGQLPNTPENLIRWIMDPREVEPGTAMPDLGVSEAEARNIAAYLEGLG